MLKLAPKPEMRALESFATDAGDGAARGTVNARAGTGDAAATDPLTGAGPRPADRDAGPGAHR